MTKMKTGRILLIYTGGTIGMGKNPTTGALEPLDIANLLKQVQEIRYINTDVDIQQFPHPIDSSDVTPKLWEQIVQIIQNHYEQYDGFVILHGTDTMAYTASALSFMLQNLTKPVILTGSQLPVGLPRTDGKENLLTSIELAAAVQSDGKPYTPEVCIYFSGRLLRGNRTTKINADGFHAFESFNYPHLCDAGVDFKFHQHHILQPDYNCPLLVQTEMRPDVAVFSLFPGITEPVVRHMLEAPNLKAIVMRSFGSGNAPQQQWLVKALKNANDNNIVVVNISQCIAGSVQMQRYDSGFWLHEAGVISGNDSTVEAAVTKLMYLLAQYNDPDTVRLYMEKNLVGEITV